MADSTVTDFTKMKVVELRKELKSRGLLHTGDKGELISRLQAAVHDDSQDINLDSDEIDSDAVLEDEDEKSQSEIILDTLNEELALADPPPVALEPVEAKPKPQWNLKRKQTEAGKIDANSDSESKESKKITLVRPTTVATLSEPDDTKSTLKETEMATNNDAKKTKITFDSGDVKSKMEMRAKRFGLPVKMSESERKEARSIRFGQGSSEISAGNGTSDLEKLKKRAERFGQSVSKVMIDIENREKLEKRKAKFNAEK